MSPNASNDDGLGDGWSNGDDSHLGSSPVGHHLPDKGSESEGEGDPEGEEDTSGVGGVDHTLILGRFYDESQGSDVPFSTHE